MCIRFAYRTGKIGIMKNFMHATETLVASMPTIARNRFRFQYRIRKFENGKAIKEETRYVTNLKESFSIL